MTTREYTPAARGNPLARLWIGNWSIWLRLIIGFLAAVLIPAALTFTLINNQIESVDVGNLEAYIQDTGIHQREDLNDYFVNARSELSFLAESRVYSGPLDNVLRFNTNPTSLRRIIAEYFDRRLVATGLFTDAVVLSTDGFVIVSSTQAGTSNEPAFEAETSFIDEEIYRAAFNASTLGATQRIAISTDADTGELVIRLAQMIYSFEGEVTGYIVATFNKDTLIEALDYDSEFIANPRSYLATVNGDIIATANNIEAARQSFLSGPIEDALARNSGVEIYSVGDQSTVGYYGPVDEFFAYIIETEADAGFSLTLREIYENSLFLVLGALILALLGGVVFTQTIISGLRSLEQDLAAIGAGDYDRPVRTANRYDEIGQVARTLINVRQQVADMVANLETRVQARVRDLEATQEVSRFAATQRDQQVLMDQVVDLIVNRFPNIYHAQIFLLDSDRRYAVLRASTGEAGQQLLARGHRLEVGGVSVIGQVTNEMRVVVARDAADSDIHRRNEFLPETEAELAIPLRIGDEIIGALDVQSKQNNSFREGTINILQVMADAIAIAIENARLYQQSVQQLQEVMTSNRDATRMAWREHMNGRRQQMLVEQAGANLNADVSPLRQQAMETGEAAIGEVTERDTVPFAVPIVLRQQVLGAVQWELPATDFNSYKVQLAQELVGRLALSLENARLFQESRRAINRERLVNDIAAQLTGQTDINMILETAVREVGQALRTPQVSIQLNRISDTAQPEDDNDLLPTNGASASPNGNQTD